MHLLAAYKSRGHELKGRNLNTDRYRCIQNLCISVNSKNKNKNIGIFHSWLTGGRSRSRSRLRDLGHLEPEPPKKVAAPQH